MSERVILKIDAWHTECGGCGYGRGGWASSPALKDPPQPVLDPGSRECPGCGERFTHVLDVYSRDGVVPIVESEAA